MHRISRCPQGVLPEFDSAFRRMHSFGSWPGQGPLLNAA
jgi:hypothetical protein